MASRLSQVEQLNKRLSAKVAEQNQEIAELQARLEAAQRAAGGTEAAADNGPSAADAALRAERDELKSQLVDMRKFLKEYGLQWVPGAPAAAEEASGTQAPAAGRRDGACAAERLGRPQAARSGVSVDIQVITARVESLNAMLEEEGKQVISQHAHGAVHARLAGDTALPMPLTFFRDGVKLGDHAFLPFESRTAQDLLKDVLDGFFPKALKDTHPDGVALRVVDRTGNCFKEWLREFSRSDPELVEGGARLRPTGGRAMGARAEGTEAERLLARLPERVVRGGRVCEVRGPLAEQLGAPAAARGSSEPPAPGRAAQEQLSLLATGRDAAAPSARLQVKLEAGQRVALLMEPSASIGELWQALERWRAQHGLGRTGADGKAYVLRTAFPPQSYTDHKQTLEAAGLTPSATLFVTAEASEH